MSTMPDEDTDAPPAHADAALPAEGRRARMAATVAERGFAKVTDLAEAFGISRVTVRADLELLERQGRLRRVRGGAMYTGRDPRVEPSFEQALTDASPAKTLIGRAAAALVSSTESVILDVGTTTTFVARALIERDDLCDLVVFTNGLTIALELERAIPRFTVVVTGGTLRPLQHSLIDPLGGLILERVHADTLFLGCNGVHPTGGITNVNLPEAESKRSMLRAAGRRVVVADASKLGRIELASVCPIADVDLLVTSAGADPDTVRALREAGLEVLIVGE